MKRTQLKKGKTLTDTAIANLKAEIQEYSVKDSKGLYLFVKPTGAKSWKMRYKDGNGKWRWHGLGGYPTVTGAMARLLVQQKYKELALGAGELIAPTTAKKDSLADVWQIWLNEPQNKKLANSSKVRHQSTMKHILPTLGREPLKDIDRQKWLATFRKIAEHTHHQTKKPTAKEAYRAWQLINRLYIFAINENLAMIESNPVSGLDKRLDTPTPAPMAHLSLDQLPRLLHAIHGVQSPQTRIGLLLLAHMFTRPNELFEAHWCEVDLKNGLWTIPAHRMKKRKEFTIPLSKQVLALLKELHKHTGNTPHLFPHDERKPRNSYAKFYMALRRIRKKLDLKQTLHGFRHIASTTLNNHTGENGQKFDERVIEFALSHKVQGVKGVYNKAEYLNDRKILMQWYSELLAHLAGVNMI